MLTRRRGLLTGVTVLAAVLVTAMSALAATPRHHSGAYHGQGTNGARAGSSGHGGLPIAAIESALQIKGTASHGVLSEGFDRTDINNVTLQGVPIKPSFQINGEFDFQPLGGGRALMNGDLPVQPSEIDP